MYIFDQKLKKLFFIFSYNWERTAKVTDSFFFLIFSVYKFDNYFSSAFQNLMRALQINEYVESKT